MRRAAILTLTICTLLATACEGRRSDDAPVVISAIGTRIALSTPTQNRTNLPDDIMVSAIAQGLVRFDGAGGIEPGIAERWIVSDGGRSFIFRLREAYWADGSPVTAGQVARILRRATASTARTSLSPYLAVIDEIVEMTPQVVEIRLTRPRPDFLKLLAQPELAIQRAPANGTGPFRASAVPDAVGTFSLAPVRDPAIDEDETPPDPADMLMLRGERAALAIARFAARTSDLVLGGSYADWPMLAHTDIAPANIRTDPAAGLFGLAVVSRQGFLSSNINRHAIAMAIDRSALTAQFRGEWRPVETILPAQLDSATAPALPDWQPLSAEERRETARARVAAWRAANPSASPAVRIALPGSPGANLIWRQLRTDLAAIGLQPVRVDADDDTDLVLIDAVSPYDSGRWYQVTACRRCPEALTQMIDAARDAPQLAERASRIAAADMAMVDDCAYIPIAQPLRWSLVALRLQAWQANSRAWHPLTHLRRPGR